MSLSKDELDKVRCIEGFPIGNDEDIMCLSDPPNYTACPNPFIDEFIKENRKSYDENIDDYKREPFTADITEGKNDPLYMAHSYHTKVPYKAIMRYILHYTEPGDLVFDGFCGSGMTGVAAQLCGNPDKEFKFKIESEMPNIKWGARKPILNDLSPIATFISYNYNNNVDIYKFEYEAKKIIAECEKECGWMYKTSGNNTNVPFQQSIYKSESGVINYTVWSDVFICPNCSNEIIYWNEIVDENEGSESKDIKCPYCALKLSLKSMIRSIQHKIDDRNNIIEEAKQVPVLIKYTIGKKQYKKKPDFNDLAVIEKINALDITYWYPKDEIPYGYNTEQPKKSHGIYKVSQFYTKRNLYVLSFVFDKISRVENKRIRSHLIFWFSSIYSRSTKLNRYMPNHDRHVGPLAGTLYIPYFQAEINIINLLQDKLKAIIKAGSVQGNALINTGSLTDVNLIKDNSIDYIFTDPPFGDNLNYSELSFIWESWLKVKTNNVTEAVINKAQNKGLNEYQYLMEDCFKQYFRVLKPNRWITIEFHNSKNAVWACIQEALIKAGFIVADVRTLDKVKGTTKQLTYNSSVKQDLIISAYKPKNNLKQMMMKNAGNEETAWDFSRQHLENLPVVVVKNDKIEIIVERQAFLLFDRMVAYHIMNGIPVSIDAADFYKGLDEKFLKRDGMYFLHDQVNEYDTARITSDVENVQMALFVSDEKTAIAWLYQQLTSPQTYSEIQPKFMQEIRSIEKYEKLPELLVLLDDNFLQNDEGKWYIPDVRKAADVAKLREKRLLKEFEEYLNSTGKLKLFRLEAIRAGFAKLWKDKNYALIVKTAERLPESVIQEDDKLLMYYDISLSRME